MIRLLICYFRGHDVDWDAVNIDSAVFEAMRELTPANCTAKWPVFYKCNRCRCPVIVRHIYVEGKIAVD